MTERSAPAEYRLLREFRRLFEGKTYKHRDSSQGDFVAMHLYEDLITINRSPKIIDAAINRKDRVLNVQNRRRGVAARRGDGTFGEIIPGETPIADSGYLVARGPIATVEIGVEVKVLAKAMIKQIDRVINDLRNQVAQFRRGGESDFRRCYRHQPRREHRKLRRESPVSNYGQSGVPPPSPGGRRSGAPTAGAGCTGIR